MEKIKWVTTIFEAVGVLAAVKLLGTVVAGLYPPVTGFGFWGITVSGIVVVGAGILVGRWIADKFGIKQ